MRPSVLGDRGRVRCHFTPGYLLERLADGAGRDRSVCGSRRGPDGCRVPGTHPASELRRLATIVLGE